MPVRPTRRDLLSAALVAGAAPLLPRVAIAADALQFGPSVPFYFYVIQDIERRMAQSP